MGHKLITGMTESGKSTFAMILCKAFKSKGIPTAVLDPMLDPNYDCTFHTDNPDEFSKWWRLNQKGMLFVDEAGESIGRYNEPMQQIVTRARHWGHTAWLCCQGGTQLPPIVRSQCTDFFVFRVDEGTREMIASLVGEKTLVEYRPPKLEFAHCNAFLPMRFGKIIFQCPTTPLHEARIVYNDGDPRSDNKGSDNVKMGNDSASESDDSGGVRGDGKNGDESPADGKSNRRGGKPTRSRLGRK